MQDFKSTVTGTQSLYLLLGLVKEQLHLWTLSALSSLRQFSLSLQHEKLLAAFWTDQRDKTVIYPHPYFSQEGLQKCVHLESCQLCTNLWSFLNMKYSKHVKCLGTFLKINLFVVKWAFCFSLTWVPSHASSCVQEKKKHYLSVCR